MCVTVRVSGKRGLEEQVRGAAPLQGVGPKVCVICQVSFFSVTVRLVLTTGSQDWGPHPGHRRKLHETPDGLSLPECLLQVSLRSSDPQRRVLT